MKYDMRLQFLESGLDWKQGGALITGCGFHMGVLNQTLQYLTLTNFSRHDIDVQLSYGLKYQDFFEAYINPRLMTSYVDAEPIFPQEVIDKIPESLKEYDPNQLFEDVWLTYYGLGLGCEVAINIFSYLLKRICFGWILSPLYLVRNDMSGLTFAPRLGLMTFLVKAKRMMNNLGWYVFILMLAGCAHDKEKAATAKVPFLPPIEKQDAFASPAPRYAKGDILLWNARVLTAAGAIHEPGYVWVSGGLIKEVGPDRPNSLPPEVNEIDLSGKVITLGLIDTHSHLGVYASPGARAHSDGNEATGPTTGQVWAEHSFWPQDPGLWRAVSGGVTTIQVPTWVSKPIGRSFFRSGHLRPAVSARAMRFPGAPQGVKMACGEKTETCLW